MGQMMELYSWRTSLSVLAVAMAVVLIGSIYFGLADGGGAGENSAEEQPGAATKDAAYLRQGSFWFIGLAVATAFMSSLVVAICYPSHFISIGFSKADAGRFLMAGGMAGLVGKLMIAAVIDRFKSKLKFFAIFLLLVQVFGLSGLLMTETLYPTILSVMLLGFGGGAFIPMHPILNAGYFDAAIIGRVGGAQMPMMLPLGLVGLPLSGYVFDQTGSYQLVFSGVILMFLIATILLLKLPKIDLGERT
jgi:cyanate permease